MALSNEDKKDVSRAFGKKAANAVAKSTVDYAGLAKHVQSKGYKRNLSSREIQSAKKGFDSQKRWGNSAVKGYGVNSPAMMEARSKAIHAKTKGTTYKVKSHVKKHHDDLMKYETN